MQRPGEESRSDAEPIASLGESPGWARLTLTSAWFGLVTGWLELGWIVSRRWLDPRLSPDMLRTNRHYLWMVPVSDLAILAALGLAIVPLARLRPRIAMQLWITLTISALLLTIEGLYAIADVILACGIATWIEPWLARRASGFNRLVRWSVPVMTLGLIVLTGVTYERVTTAERRALAACPPAKSGMPNVLLIVLDNVRTASLSLYGHNRPTTPNLERLARRGLVFTEARSPAPWTLPAHAGMFTGHWPYELSVGPEQPLDETFPTLAQSLGREGYATAGFVGNTKYCNAHFGIDRGFARYEDDYENQVVSLFETIRSSGLGKRVVQLLGHPIRVADGVTSVRKSAQMINRDVVDWLAGRPADHPYFVFINYYDAHAPFLPPEGPDPRFGMAALPYHERVAIDERYVRLTSGKPAPGDGTADRIVNEAIEMYRDSYESCIAYLDRQIGLLFDELERRDALENTLVIVTSDHGEHFGEHGLLGHGLSLYRHEVHVPLVLIPPSNLGTATIANEPVSLRDIPATVAEYVGLGSRSPFPGRSLARFLGQGADRLPEPEPAPVLSEVQHIESFPRSDLIPSSLGPVRSLMSRELVYIRHDGGREELYDLWNDPVESDDLARLPESSPVLDRFREQLQQLDNAEPTLSR